jgi:NAD-dependent dihydropyrimidine dehydrogenase PreA subunit
MILRKIIEIDNELCDGCGKCVPDCAEGALEVIDGKARMIAEKYCDGLGACLGSCPTGALRIIKREAEDFDEYAVEELLKQKKNVTPPEPKKVMKMGGCPSARIINLQPVSPCQAANQPRKMTSDTAMSNLTHWPIQIRLVPPAAPFLKNASLLVAADCTPIAYPGFHDDFLAGKAVMMGCPKFDDTQGYINKFVEVFKTASPQDVTILIMEVPCCSTMNMIIREALKKSECQIPVEQVTIGVRGEILSRETW